MTHGGLCDVCPGSAVTMVNPGSWVSLNFTAFSTQEGYDFVYVHEGVSTRRSLVRRFSGQLDAPDTLISVRSGKQALAWLRALSLASYACWRCGFYHRITCASSLSVLLATRTTCYHGSPHVAVHIQR